MEDRENMTKPTVSNIGTVGDDTMLRIERLEAENKKMQNEFNGQRAKLKELFLQKESELAKCLAERKDLQEELDELKCQYMTADWKLDEEMKQSSRKAQEEILSLQQLVQDTLEESTIVKGELERLKKGYNRLKQDNQQLKETIHNHESHSLAPKVLSQVTKSIVQKFSGDAVNPTIPSPTPMHQERNEKTLFHEDSEVLRSIVEQLQEEMKALKEKLREADIKLQEKTSCLLINLDDDDSAIIPKNQNPENTKETSTDEIDFVCEKCLDFEKQIDELNQKVSENNKTIEKLKIKLDDANEDVEKQSVLRKQLEDEWIEKRDAYTVEMDKLKESMKSNEESLLEAQQKMLLFKDSIQRRIQEVADERQKAMEYIETFQKDYDFLSGRFLATAQEIESQFIDLPTTVEELQEIILKQRETIIQARVNSEFEKKKSVSSSDEIQLLREKLDECISEKRAYERKVQTQMKSLQDRLTEHLLTLQSHETTKADLERKQSELNKQISELRVEIIELQEANEKLNKMNSEYRSKIKNLQDDLTINEQVQKDFVTLSQRLQMSLEQLRRADTEVRWQDDDDVDNCPTCNSLFTVTFRRIHCRHCGQIYCDKCLTKSVPSGPRKRLARVCDICHTLLTPNVAPYFSQEPKKSSKKS